VVVYTVVHQPRRLKLPAQLIPGGTPGDRLASYLFDDDLDRHYFDKVTEYSYVPATAAFRELGGLGIIREQQQVYLNFIRALDEFAV
jgi:alpha-amylase